MKQSLGLVFAAALGLLPLSAAAQSTPAPTPVVGDGAGHEEIIVDFDDNASEADMQAAARAAGVVLQPNSFLFAQDHLMRASVPVEQAAGLLARFRTMHGVEAADENVLMHADFTPNDPQLGDQWGMTRVGAPLAWNFSCGRGAIVAVVDTGVACENHGEFTRVLDLNGTRCLPGYDFVSDTEHANDDQGHGTHVAGTIAQTTNNGFGVAGLAYCSTILPVKVLNRNGSGSLGDVAEGIRYAADHGAQVINLSLGGGGHSKVMAAAIAHARSRGAVVICAAGNNGAYVESPASEPGAFAVSAIDSGDQIAYFSSRGPEVQIAAPGVNVLQQTICDHGRNRCEQFASWSGTSMAAPHVAGIAALIVSMGVTEPTAIERILRETAVAPEHGGRDRELYGAGIVSASNAVMTVQTRNAWARGLALLLLIAALFYRIRSQKGQFASPLAWAIPALFTSLGLFFLPWVTSRVIPGVDLAMRPIGDWSILLGAGIHRWMPFANALVALALVGLGFSRKAWRAPIGGFALGTAAYLLAGVFTGFNAAPLGGILRFGWIIANIIGCIWIARIALDTKTAESSGS